MSELNVLSYQDGFPGEMQSAKMVDKVWEVRMKVLFDQASSKYTSGFANCYTLECVWGMVWSAMDEREMIGRFVINFHLQFAWQVKTTGFF